MDAKEPTTTTRVLDKAADRLATRREPVPEVDDSSTAWALYERRRRQAAQEREA